MAIAPRYTACLAVVLSCFLACRLSAQEPTQELPTKTGTEDLEAEAKKLMEELPTLDLPLDVEAPQSPAPGETPELNVERTKAALERARQKQKRWEKLARQGVLSRAEAESCVVEVAAAQAKHEAARLAQLQQQHTELEERLKKGEVDQTMVEASNAAIQSATQAAAETKEQARVTKLNAARTNVDRFKKLYAARLISKNQLQRAVSALERLEAEATPATEPAPPLPTSGR
jgi:multidrug resistance efflux pump